MSTRLSTEALEEIGAFFHGVVAQQLIAEVEASWTERDAALRALRDLTAAIDAIPVDVVPKGEVEQWERDLVVAADAARAVLSENPE